MSENNSEFNETPFYSRCSMGKDRWFWVAYKSFAEMYEYRIHSSGYAATSEEAERDAKASIFEDLGCESPETYPTSFAKYAHRRINIKKQSKNRSKSSGAAKPEFVYTYEDIPYRIIKKTKKRFYIEKHASKWKEGDDEFHDIEVFVLDRDKMEREGCAYSHKRRDFYYRCPREERRSGESPQCYLKLGLDRNCSRDEIDLAYRTLVMEHHPDRGGDAEEFKVIQGAYEEIVEYLVY